jgi:hypothetical protein
VASTFTWQDDPEYRVGLAFARRDIRCTFVADEGLGAPFYDRDEVAESKSTALMLGRDDM